MSPSISNKDRWGVVGRHSITAALAAIITLFTRGEALGRDLERLDSVVVLAKENEKQLKEEHDAVLKMGKDVETLLKGMEALQKSKTSEEQLLNEIKTLLTAIKR